MRREAGPRGGQDRRGTTPATISTELPVKRHPHPKAHKCHSRHTFHPLAHARTGKHLARKVRAPDQHAIPSQRLKVVDPCQ